MGFVVGSHCRCAAVPARKAGPGRPQEALDNPTTTKANFNLVTPDRPSSTHVFNWYICFERLYRVRRRRLEDAADRLQRVGCGPTVLAADQKRQFALRKLRANTKQKCVQLDHKRVYTCFNQETALGCKEVRLLWVTSLLQR